VNHDIRARPPLRRRTIRPTTAAPQDIGPGGQRAQGVGATLGFGARILAAHRGGQRIKLLLEGGPVGGV
jgi:hypothetical protein